MWTRDGIHWERRLTVVPDEHDVTATELYALSLFTEAREAVAGRPALALEQHKYNVAIEGDRTYMGAIYVYDSQAGRQWPEAVWIRDPLHWHRFQPRRKMIANGPRGTYNYGMVKIRSWYYQFGDEWWFPYIAINGLKQDYPGLGRCQTVEELRRLYPQYDKLPGFANWDQFWKRCKAMRYYPSLARCPQGRVCHAEPVGDRGVLTTGPVTLRGDTLVLNASTEDNGRIAVEVVNDGGQPIAGFDRKQCIGFRGDSLRAAIVWKDVHLGQLQRQTVRLRFVLDRARLYTFHVESSGD